MRGYRQFTSRIHVEDIVQAIKGSICTSSSRYVSMLILSFDFFSNLYFNMQFVWDSICKLFGNFQYILSGKFIILLMMTRPQGKQCLSMQETWLTENGLAGSNSLLNKKSLQLLLRKMVYWVRRELAMLVWRRNWESGFFIRVISQDYKVFLTKWINPFQHTEFGYVKLHDWHALALIPTSNVKLRDNAVFQFHVKFKYSLLEDI